MILFTHPAVNAYTRNIAQALSESGQLYRMITALGWRVDQIPDWLPDRWKLQLSRRALPNCMGENLRTHPAREAGRLLASTLKSPWFTRHEEGVFCVDAVYRDLDRYAALYLKRIASSIQMVYAGEDAALETFAMAQDLGKTCAYDLPTVYFRELQRLMAEEKESMPAFAATFQGVLDSPAKLARKDREVASADVIVVCSRFVQDSLTRWGVPREKIRVVPYGAPEQIRPREPAADEAKRPLRVLFVGSLGQRKGIGYLLEALRRLNRRDVELVLMGSIVGDGSQFEPYRDFFRLESPRPHGAVLNLMRTCHVLVLPSIVDGFGMVVTEAMACGLAVIVTPNTGAADLVRDGVDGFVVPIRSAEAIAEKISLLADDRTLAVEMGRSAVSRAASRTWVSYRCDLLAALGLGLNTQTRGATSSAIWPNSSFL